MSSFDDNQALLDQNAAFGIQSLYTQLNPPSPSAMQIEAYERPPVSQDNDDEIMLIEETTALGYGAFYYQMNPPPASSAANEAYELQFIPVLILCCSPYT